MPRKSKATNPATKREFPVGPYHLSEDAPWGGFINIRLQDEQKAAFDEWVESNAVYTSVRTLDLLADGIKITFAWDPEHQCFLCTFTGALVDGDTGRYAMTTRAGDFVEVLNLAIWKHDVLAKGSYREYLPKSSNFRTWG